MQNCMFTVLTNRNQLAFCPRLIVAWNGPKIKYDNRFHLFGLFSCYGICRWLSCIRSHKTLAGFSILMKFHFGKHMNSI